MKNIVRDFHLLFTYHIKKRFCVEKFALFFKNGIERKNRDTHRQIKRTLVN